MLQAEFSDICSGKLQIKLLTNSQLHANNKCNENRTGRL